MLIICGSPQWISEQLLYVFINIVISTYMGSACDVPNKTVHLCDHHQKNYNSHDNEENSVKYIASNGGEITYHNNDENEIEKLGSMDDHFLLDDIHTCYENVTVLYLAGYDDEIFELRNDLLKKGEGNELVIYFFLYRDHKILNIGKIHTNIIFFDESILKYTHYYYLDSETVKNTCCFNKLRFENLEDDVPDEAINENKSKYFTLYPQKENDGYEFIIPKEKDIVMKDIIVDLNKNKDDKLNKPAGSASVFTSSLLDQPNDNEIYYVDEDFLNPCTHDQYLKRKDKKDYMKKNQTLKSHMEISPPIELESKTEDVLDEQSKSILSNTKRVLVPCNDDNLEQTYENLLTFTPVTSTLINSKPKDTEKTRVSKIFKDKSIKNFQNHKDTTYYRLPKTLDSNTKTITDQVNLYKNPFSDVNVKGFNIVAPILFQGNRIDKNVNDNNHVRPNDSHYYSHEKPSDDILLNAEYDINKPNYKAISHIHTSNQYIPNKMLPTKVVSKNTDTQIKNIPFVSFKHLSSFSDGSYKNQDKILGSYVPYYNNYTLNPSYVTYKQNLNPLENKKYSTINPVVNFSIPVITSSSNIKINDKNKKIASLPESYSLYYRNSATQKKKYEPNKTLIHTPSILNIPCQKLTNDKCRVLNADSTNIFNIPRDLDVSLINTNEKLSASPQVYGYHFYSSKYNINDKIKPEEIKAYPYYSKYNELLPASYVPKLHATNFIPNIPYYLPKEHSNLSKSVNHRLHSFKTFASSTNTPVQSKYDFISSQPDLYEPIRTKVYQPLEDILESSNMPMNGNPNIIHYVESDFLLNKEKPMTSGILSETGRLIPFLIKKDLNKPETSALPLQPNIELVRRKSQNMALTSSEEKGAQATYESPLNVVICKNKYAIPNPNINIVKNLNFIKKAGIPKLSTLNQDPYENVSWFKKYQQNIPELLPYTKLAYFPKIKPSTKIAFQNSYTPSAPIYSSEIPKSPQNLISLTLAPVSAETIHMSQKPVNIIEFPSRNDLSISSKNFQSTQFVSLPKFKSTSNQLNIDLRNPIKKQIPSRFRPNIYQYPSKYHLTYEPDVMSDTIFKWSQHVLKSNVPTLNREPASSYVFNNKNLSSLTKLSQHRFWPQNILTSPITSQIAAMSKRNKMLYRPKENFKEYLLKSYLSFKPQVVTTPVQSLHEAIPNKPIIEDISPIPSYKKMFKVNKPDVSSKIIFTLPQERLKSSIPIFNQESPTTKDTVCIKNLKLHTFPYVKPLQYSNWPQNIVTLPITSPYMVPARNQAKKNLDQYPLKPYLSAKPQSVPASALPIISLSTSTPKIKSSSRSPVPGIRNIPQSDITSQHVPRAEMNKYLHLSKENINQYPPRSYSRPEDVTIQGFSFKSPITPVPRASSSPNLPLYETISKKQTHQGISPSYIKLYKLNDPDISTNTIFTSPFYVPNFNQESPTATGTLSYKNLKVQTNPCIEKPSQYLNWPQNIIPIASPHIVSPESIQKLHLPKQNLNLYPLKPYLAPQLQSEPVLAFPITSQTTSIPTVQSSTKSPVSAIRSWPKNILTSSIASPHLTTPERNKNLYLSKQNVTQYPPKLYSSSKPLQVFFKSNIIICPEKMSSSSPLPLYGTAPTNSIIQEISPIIEPAMSSNIFTLPQQPLKLSLTNFNQVSPTTTDTLSNKNFEPQTNPCVTNHVLSQYRNWPQNNIPSPITSPYVITHERNQNLHFPMKNLNQFPLQPLRASLFPFTELTHIPSEKSFLLPNKPAVKIILLNNSHKQTYKLNKPDTLSRTKFPLPKQYYKQNLLDINQEPVFSKHIFNLSYPKYITYKPKEVYSLPKQFSLPYDKFKVLPTNEYKSIPKSKLNTVPSISPLTITKIWSPNGKAYAPLFSTISPSKQFSLRPEQRFPIIFFKPIDKNVSSPTMKSVYLIQPTFKNSLNLPPHLIPLPSLPSSIQYPYQHTSLDSNSLNFSTKVDSMSPIAISRNNKLHSPYLLPKKVSQNKITPKLSSSSNSLLENSLQFQTPNIQDTVSKAKPDNLPLSSIDNTNNKKHYPHFETLPFSNMKSFLRNFKVPNQAIYIPFPSKMNLKSPNSFITSKSLRLPMITSSEPSKSDLPRILSSTLAYPLQKSVLPFTPLAQSLSEITPSQFRPANGQSLNLPTERKLLKNPLTLPFKYDSISHHPHYEPVHTLDTESSAAHFNLPNRSMIYNKYKNILKSSYKNQNDVTYLTENQDQVSFNKDVINTQSTFSKVLNAHPNYLPSLKTLELYPTYKPYTTTYMIYPSLSIAKATNNFSPLQPNSNIIPFKSHLSYIQPFIKTPSYYQTEHQGTSAPIITPSHQSISVKNSPSRQFEPTNILTIPSKWSLLTTLQAPAASLFKSDLTSLSLPLLKSSSILSSYLHHPVYKPLPTLDSEILISPPNLIKKSTWPLNKPNFTPKTFGKYQSYQPFNSQDRVILNINNINTQPSMTPITKVTSKSFNKFKLYPSFKPLNIQAFKAPFSISNVDTTNKHILLQPQPDSSYLKPSERTAIPDYYQTTSPNQLAWTKTIATGNSKDMGTLYHIQTSKSSTNQQLKKSLTSDMNTLKPNLAYSSPTISSPAAESYHSAENADFLTDKAFAFEKSSSYPLPLNFKLRSNMYPIYKGSKIKYFTSNTEIPSKTVNNLDTGKYNHINYLQEKPITKNQLYSNILYNNNNYKKKYPIIYSVNHRTHILSPLETLNGMNLYQQEFLRDRERNLNIPVAKILQKSNKPDLGLREIVVNNEINENIPFIRTQGMKQFRKEIPLPNISILKYDPSEISNDVELATDNPDIFIKAWTSRIEVIKPRIVYDTFQVQAYNFEPIVKELGKYDPNVVEGVVKSYVEKNYGEPIVLKGTYSFYKPYIISNVNNKYLKHGKIYLVWPTLCDCGCKHLGCQCYRKFYKLK